jgi:hypothetical protein
VTDTTPPTDEQLAAIRARHATYRTRHDHPRAFACCSAHEAADDVPVLLAEVGRLRVELALVDEEIEEIEAAAGDDPNTPEAVRLMIQLLRKARTVPHPVPTREG